MNRLASAAIAVGILLAGCSAEPGDRPKPTATATSAPTKPTALDITDLPNGAAPKVGWSRGTLLNGDTTQDVLPSKLDQFAQTKQLLVARDVDGNVYAYAPDGPASKTPIGKATGDLAVNQERNLAAWIAPDGSPTVLQEGQAKPAVLEKEPGVTMGDAVAVLGHDCFNGPETVEGAGCSVYFRARGEKPRSYLSSNHGFVVPVQGGKGGMSLQDANLRGEIGWTEINPDEGSTCSTYQPRDDDSAPENAGRWETCDHLPLQFSPDGAHLLATGPHGFEGLGAGSLSVLDAKTGKPSLTLRNNARSQAFIVDMTWEDDANVLAVVFQKGDWSIMRVGLDGSAELAVKPVKGNDTEIPFKLAVQP